jgi:serine/threonine protein kinase
MKPENLLIFKDYKVKIGDFGVSIKMPADSTDESTFNISGLTPFYSAKDINKLYQESVPLTKK